MVFNIKQFESSENQAVLREELLEFSRTGKMSLRSLAHRIGDISSGTIRRFLKNESDVDYRSLCVIHAFLERERQ